MKNELAMRLLSRCRLTPRVARRQILALSSFEQGLFRPDLCSSAEPIRTPFEDSDIDEPVRWLSDPAGTFMYRTGKPMRSRGVIWNHTHPVPVGKDDSGKPYRFPHPERIFLNYWTSSFDGEWIRKTGIGKVQSFVTEMFQAAGADFGLLTSHADLDAKNYLVLHRGKTISKRYRGLDPALGVPGLYWMNLFSPRLAQWLGLERLPGELDIIKRFSSDGVLLQFGESPEECRSPEILHRQQRSIDLLGQQRFFDIHRPDRELEHPDWPPMSSE
ncbi:MAG: hypothetical protein O3A53_07370 [Acidobacteria bacterium]|nr:hypothetical protein [Acidobacteriota bacterium]MDA1234605.1 hypothetical protein [Acidobacteriota bacterium]